jgi:hypothetical protein
LNNWKAVGYIFLGFGSVFIGYALIAFFGMIALSSTFFDLTPVALAANAPWLILAALMYVVGVVGYFAGKENGFKEKGKPARRRISIRLEPIWSFPIGAFATLAVLVLQTASGVGNTTEVVDGFVLPMLYSIAAGSVVGFVALLLIYGINDR